MAWPFGKYTEKKKHIIVTIGENFFEIWRMVKPNWKTLVVAYYMYRM